MPPPNQTTAPDFELTTGSLELHQDSQLQLGNESCMCNFGMAHVAAVGRSGHLNLVRRAIPNAAKADWPLMVWDEEEQEGTTFTDTLSTWVSRWLALNARQLDPEDLVVHRSQCIAKGEAWGDSQVSTLIDALLDGPRDPLAAQELIAPDSILTRTARRAADAGLRLGSIAGRRANPDLEPWRVLMEEAGAYNAPLAYAMSLPSADADLARRWLRCNMKYDTGGSSGRYNLTRKACTLLASEAEGTPFEPVITAFQADRLGGGGDPFVEAGKRLLQQGEASAAITAFENAIVFERGWSERFHNGALDGIRETAELIGSDDYKAYLAGVS